MFKFSDLLKLPIIEELVKFKAYFVIALCQIILIMFSLCIYDYYNKIRIGTVNITGIADEFVKTQAQSGVSPEALKKRVQVFGASLEKILHDVGAKKHVVLMPAEAVITGAKDYTQEVGQLLSKVMQSLPQEKKQPAAPASYLEQQTLSQGDGQIVQPIDVTPVTIETNKTEVKQKAPATQ